MIAKATPTCGRHNVAHAANAASRISTVGGTRKSIDIRPDIHLVIVGMATKQSRSILATGGEIASASPEPRDDEGAYFPRTYLRQTSRKWSRKCGRSLRVHSLSAAFFQAGV